LEQKLGYISEERENNSSNNVINNSKKHRLYFVHCIFDKIKTLTSIKKKNQNSDMKKAWQKENADLGRPSWEALDLGEDKITKTQLALVLSLAVRSAFTRRSHGAGWSHKSPKFKSSSSRSNRIVECFPHQKKTPGEILSQKTLKPSLPEARQR